MNSANLEAEILETYVDMKKLITCGLLLCLGWSVQAQTLLLTENFDYTAGDSIRANGWTRHSGNNNTIFVTSPGLSWTNTPYRASNIGNAAGVNNSGSDENRNFSSYPTSGDVYISFLAKVRVPTSNLFFLHTGVYSVSQSPNFASISTAFRGRVFAVPGTTPATFRFGLQFNAATVGSNVTADLDTSKTYMVVLKYRFNPGASNDQVSLFVFEDGADISSEPLTPTIGPLAGTAADADTLQYVALRQDVASQRITVDGIIVQTSWDMLRANNTWNGSAWSTGSPPREGDNVIIDGNLTLTSNIVAHNLTVNAGATLTMASGQNLKVWGGLSNNGIIDLANHSLTLDGSISGTGSIRSNGGSLTIAGSGALGTINFDQTTDGTTNVLANLTLNRNSTGTASLGNKLNLTGTLTLTAGTLTTNGHLHLKSTSATQTAQVVGGTNANLSGNVTVERFLPWASANNSGFRFVGHPLRSNPVINTVSNLPIATNTLITYNESTNSYEGVSNRGATWPQGVGYGVFTDASNTLSFTGELQLSAVNNLPLNNSNARWNYLANPFPTSLDWDQVARTDVQNAQWVWVKDNVVVGGGSWAAYVDGVAQSGGGQYLAPMQGFMTRAAASGSPSLSFPTAARVGAQSPSFQRTSNQADILRVTLSKNSNGSRTETIVRFRQQATMAFEPDFDAEFVTDGVNATPDLFTTDAQGTRYSINSMEPLSGQPKVVTLQTETFGAGDFTLTFNTAGLLSAPALQLEDTKTGVFTHIQNGQSISFTQASSDVTTRFRLHFNGLSTSINDMQNAALSAYAHEGRLFIKGVELLDELQIFDLSGRLVYSQSALASLTEGIQPNLTPGIYVVKLQSGSQVKNVKIKF